MKRTFIFFMVIAILFLLSSCTLGTDISGIENYQKDLCPANLTVRLFPDEEFLTLFKYEDAKFYHHNNSGKAYKFQIHYHPEDESVAFQDSSGNAQEARALAVLRYAPEVYFQAKEFCLNKFILCEQHQFVCNSYHFSEHICHAEVNAGGDMSPTCQFPKWFNAVAYNDENHTLVFLGYYNSLDDAQNALAETDFEAFLDEIYSDYYNFDQ